MGLNKQSKKVSKIKTNQYKQNSQQFNKACYFQKKKSNANLENTFQKKHFSVS